MKIINDSNATYPEWFLKDINNAINFHNVKDLMKIIICKKGNGIFGEAFYTKTEHGKIEFDVEFLNTSNRDYINEIIAHEVRHIKNYELFSGCMEYEKYLIKRLECETKHTSLKDIYFITGVGMLDEFLAFKYGASYSMKRSAPIDFTSDKYFGISSKVLQTQIKTAKLAVLKNTFVTFDIFTSHNFLYNICKAIGYNKAGIDFYINKLNSLLKEIDIKNTYIKEVEVCFTLLESKLSSYIKDEEFISFGKLLLSFFEDNGLKLIESDQDIYIKALI